MQHGFAFVTSDLARWRDRLAAEGLGAVPVARRAPIAQLVKSLISGRTRDAVSLAAYRRLGARFGSVTGLARATPDEIAHVIADVTFAPAKAEWLAAALAMIRVERADFRLDFLAALSLDAALAWLERLPGVGRKVAAATLNASTLARPVFIVDSHVLRVLRRLGFVAHGTDACGASVAVTSAMPEWHGDDFLAFHSAVKRLGQTICRFDAPHCTACPLADDCPTARG